MTARTTGALARRLALLALGGLGLAAGAHAHDGPPYPIFVDEPAGPWSLSIWTDPDVGTGTFYYYLDGPPGAPAVVVEASARGPEPGIAPVSAASVPAEAGEPFQQVGELPFERRGTWPTTFRVIDAEGRVLTTLEHDLDVTPPGLGPVDLLLYILPFAVIGLFWARALLAQRAFDRASLDPQRPEDPARNCP